MQTKQPQLKYYRNAWYAFYYVDGKRTKKSLGKNKIAAEIQFQQMFYSNPQTNVPTINQAQGKAFTAAVDMFYLSRYGVAGIWNTDYPSCIRTNPASGLAYLRKLQQFGKVQNVNEITTEMVNEFVNNLITSRGNKSYSRGPKTANRYLTFYRAFLQYCAANGWIESNPADKMLIPNMKETTPEPHNFSDEEYQMVLDNGGRYVRFFQFMYETGLRPTDTYNLTKRHFSIDKVTGRMFIKVITRKNNKSLNVPISMDAQAIVQNTKGSRLFPMFTNERTQNDAMKALKKCFNGNAQGAGARFCHSHNIVMHSFRHTFAMRKFENGKPIEVISQLMGHSVTAMTEKYARYLPKTKLIDHV